MRLPPRLAGGRLVDLHSHTYFSDGLLSPEALVTRAAEKRLAALGITDHDSVEGLPRAREAAEPTMEIVCGVELSAAWEGSDLHILGYYVDPEREVLRERLARFGAERRDRAREMLRRLGDLGIALDGDAILAAAEPGVVGRPHLARALVEAGRVESEEDAFRRYLGSRGAVYVPRPAFQPQEAIALIHAAGGASVLAHPGPMLSGMLLEWLVDVGLRGVEVWHPQHNPATVRRYRALARRLGLVETGGSDFHGPSRGLDLGALNVPATILVRLREAASR